VVGGVLDDFVSGTLRNWRIVFPDTGATEWDFAAFVTGYEPKMPHDGALTADISLELSGTPTLA
jgi:predicted secreted protein